jgi:hypothetical protein
MALVETLHCIFLHGKAYLKKFVPHEFGWEKLCMNLYEFGPHGCPMD